MFLTFRRSIIITLSNLCDYAGYNFRERKFVEGDRIYSCKTNIFECGVITDGIGPNQKIKALCLKTSRMRDGYFEIDGEIKPDGTIVNFICSCPAGNSHQCKHVIGTLFYCMQYV